MLTFPAMTKDEAVERVKLASSAATPGWNWAKGDAERLVAGLEALGLVSFEDKAKAARDKLRAETRARASAFRVPDGWRLAETARMLLETVSMVDIEPEGSPLVDHVRVGVYGAARVLDALDAVGLKLVRAEPTYPHQVAATATIGEPTG